MTMKGFFFWLSFLFAVISVRAWMPSFRDVRRKTSCLAADRENAYQQQTRSQIVYCSVSPEGFWVFLDALDQKLVPIRVTSNYMDAQAATSAHALTILQLFGDLDLAGAVLPPELLSQLTIQYCKETMNDNSDEILKTLGEIELGPRRRLPTVTLDQVTISLDGDVPSFTLDVAAKLGQVDGTPATLSINPSRSTLGDLIWTDELEETDASLLSFACLALSLRYKAPVILGSSSPAELMSVEEIKEKFPQITHVDKLKQTSSRVGNNIERSFRVNQLQAALVMAQRKKDEAAILKIRAALDELDSLQDLPTQPESDTESMQ